MGTTKDPIERRYSSCSSGPRWFKGHPHEKAGSSLMKPIELLVVGICEKEVM